VDTVFARVAGIQQVAVSAMGAAVVGVLNGVDTNDQGYGPFAVWYGEVAKHYNSANPKTPTQQCIDAANGSIPKQFGCIGKGSSVVYRANGWGDCPNGPGNGTVLSESTCLAGSPWSVGSNNFKGDISLLLDRARPAARESRAGAPALPRPSPPSSVPTGPSASREPIENFGSRVARSADSPLPDAEASARSWDRWELAPGVELHVRADAALDNADLIRRLLHAARPAPGSPKP
jgi:hypothetical protein